MDQQRRAEAKGDDEESQGFGWHFETMPAVPAALQDGSWELLAARRTSQGPAHGQRRPPSHPTFGPITCSPRPGPLTLESRPSF